MYITNIFDVLALITPFTKCLEKCILVHINKDGLNLSAFIVLLIKFSLARTECAAVTALFSKSIFAHGELGAEMCFPLASSVTSVRDNSRKVEDLAPFVMFVHAVIADV